MFKSITRTMLTSAMGFAWDLIRTGEHIVATSERLGKDEAYDLRAGFVEMSVCRSGQAVVLTGEGLELFVNAVATKLGYRDGEVSGMVALACTGSLIAVA